MNMIEELNAVADEKVRALLETLHTEASAQEEPMKREMAPFFKELQQGRPVEWSQIERRVSDKYIALDPAQGVFCYLLAKATGARRIVEFGTSFGVSTIYLAMAVRDNGGGMVIGTEIVAEKAKRAEDNLRKAGLAEFVEIRVGNALDTLKDLREPVDFFLNDGFPPFALPVFKLVAPKMRAGAVVVSDNVGFLKAAYAEYLAYLHNPANGFQSVLMGLEEGTEFSVKMAGSV
jgi:predicted O-methyltransferase YrrM